IPWSLMAARGQLDCGQCGYECRTYAAAIADGAETDLGKCVPGGRETAKKLKELAKAVTPASLVTPAQAGAQLAKAGAQSPKPIIERGYGRDAPVPARLLSTVALGSPTPERETRHVVIDISKSEVAYEPGDSLGLWPPNHP